jgi:hypothetical protein
LIINFVLFQGFKSLRQNAQTKDPPSCSELHQISVRR